MSLFTKCEWWLIFSSLKMSCFLKLMLLLNFWSQLYFNFLNLWNISTMLKNVFFDYFHLMLQQALFTFSTTSSKTFNSILQILFFNLVLFSYLYRPNLNILQQFWSWSQPVLYLMSFLRSKRSTEMLGLFSSSKVFFVIKTDCESNEVKSWDNLYWHLGSCKFYLSRKCFQRQLLAL